MQQSIRNKQTLYGGITVVYIIVIIVILVILSGIYSFFEGLSDAVGKNTLLITGILCVISFFAFSWIGVLIVAALGIGGSYLLQKTRETLREHDANARKTAQINQQTSLQNAQHNNQLALQEELDKNCRWLGEMTPSKWKEKLPNYASKSYETSFEQITSNFAKQMEQQMILQNDDWFTPFMEYIVNKEATSPIKLLNEVNCPQLKITHSTSNLELLTKRLDRATQRISDDVPPLLTKMPSGIYRPTRYANERFGKAKHENFESHHETIDLDDEDWN